ncbi:unnamed protein product [Urochloa humidicola]
MREDTRRGADGAVETSKAEAYEHNKCLLLATRVVHGPAFRPFGPSPACPGFLLQLQPPRCRDTWRFRHFPPKQSTQTGVPT